MNIKQIIKEEVGRLLKENYKSWHGETDHQRLQRLYPKFPGESTHDTINRHLYQHDLANQNAANSKWESSIKSAKLDARDHKLGAIGWFDLMNPDNQEEYLKAHPNSKLKKLHPKLRHNK